MSGFSLQGGRGWGTWRSCFPTDRKERDGMGQPGVLLGRRSLRARWTEHPMGLALCAMHCEDGDFRWAVEAEGKSHGADAAIDIELQAVEPEPSFDILFA